MNLQDLLSNNSIRGQQRMNFNSTVKDEVQHIQMNLDNFRRVLDNQKKQQGQLQYSIKKLEQETKTKFSDLHKQLSDRIQYLNQSLRNDCQAQNKQFQYLQLQNNLLFGQHEKLNQMATVVHSRTDNVSNNVGA